MRILNLYAGIGGNRKLWRDGHEIIAVEIGHRQHVPSADINTMMMPAYFLKIYGLRHIKRQGEII